ncbi:TPA: YolD-like family protein [Staphylococcus aureus]
MIPKEYENETDYRKIPREYLSSNIPQGRGIVKWSAFASVPEQFETLNSYIADQNKVSKPELSDDQNALLNEQLHFKIMNNEAATIEIWKDGYFHKQKGIIHEIDMLKYVLIIDTENGKVQIPMKNITRIW